MRKIMRIIVALLIISLLTPSAFAAEKEEAIPYASAFFTATRAYLYDVEGDTFGVWFNVQGKYTMDIIGAKSIRIERSRTGTGSWDTMKTFYPSSYAQMYDYNTFYHGDSVTYTGTPGYYYRAYVVFYAEKGGNSGSFGQYTAIMQL